MSLRESCNYFLGFPDRLDARQDYCRSTFLCLPGSIRSVDEQEAAQRVGQAVEQRRLALRLTQGELAEAIGVSIKTVNNVARGATIPQKLRRADWERALGWEQGSIRALLMGGEPLVAQPGETVGPAADDAGFVSTGAGGTAGITEDELLRRLDRARAEQDAIVAELLRRRGGPGRGA